MFTLSELTRVTRAVLHNSLSAYGFLAEKFCTTVLKLPLDFLIQLVAEVLWPADYALGFYLFINVYKSVNI